MQGRPWRKKLPIGGEGNLDEIILALTESAADFLRHSHDAKRNAVDHDFLVEGIDAGEECIHQILPDEAHHGLMLVIGFGDVSAALHLLLADVDHVGRHTGDVHVYTEWF